MIADFLDDPIEVFPKVDPRVVKETLSRIGVVAKSKPILYPSCYLLEDEGRWFVVHFKEIFRLVKRDESYDNMTDEDIRRKKSIVFCLKSWGLVDVYDNDKIEPHNIYVNVLPHKHNFEVKHKIRLSWLETIGNTLNVLEDII